MNSNQGSSECKSDMFDHYTIGLYKKEILKINFVGIEPTTHILKDIALPKWAKNS